MRVPDVDWLPTLPVLLHRAVARFRDDDLVVSPDRRLRFAEAEHRSAELAKALLAAGVSKGTRVGVMLPSNPDWVVVWLALARIGAISMLFSTTYRALEIAKALRFGDVELLIAPRRLLGRDLAAEIEEALPDVGGQIPGAYRLPSIPYLRDVWLVDDTEHPWARGITLDPVAVPIEGADVGDDLLVAVEERVAPADIVTVVYTSGSSADPKAVMHTQGTAVRKVSPDIGLSLLPPEPSRAFLAMPLFWVGGPQCVAAALQVGSTLLVQERFDADEALELIERERGTVIIGWATMLEALKSDPSYGDRDLSSLAEAPPPPPPGTPGAIVSSRGHILNVGMTETLGPHRNPDFFDYKVIDRETGESIRDGEVGEFCVRGFGLMAGLYRLEREEVFDPEGYYHTGDRGYLEHGQIYFTGRYSEMIKSGGANVAPLEVENVLLGLEDVAQAYVFGIPDPTRGEEVAAVLVPTDGVRLDPADVERRLRRILSAYKVPSRIHVMDEGDVPHLGSGKPDKRSMRKWAEERRTSTKR